MIYWDNGKYPGVSKKLTRLKTAFTSKERAVADFNFSQKKLSSIKSLLIKKYDFIFFRNHVLLLLLFSPIFLLQKSRGAKLIIECPTPLKIVFDESAEMYKGKLKGAIIKQLFNFMYPHFLNLFSKIIQYSRDEDSLIRGHESKVIFMTNGVNENEIIKRDSIEPEGKALKLLVVASFASWHGVDRLIKSLNDNKFSSKVELHLVGNGHEIDNLKSMVVKDTNNNVSIIFHGKKVGKELIALYKECDFGVASLALYRKGLSSASELKIREYLAFGLPIVMCAQDDDLQSNLKFIYQVPNDSSPLDIHKIIAWFADLDKESINEEIYFYARDNLSIEQKVKVLF